MTATKKELKTLDANFDRKMANVLLKQLQNSVKLLVQQKSIRDLTMMIEIKINVLKKLRY